MKHIALFLILLSSSISYAQNKHNYVHFNKITSIEGTDYMMARVENRNKVANTKENRLLFINTSNGDTTQLSFPVDTYFREIKQIKIDSLGINKLILFARTVNLNLKKGIDWNDPMQVIAVSPDGKEKVQLTEDCFFAQHWEVNQTTGRIVIVGYYDSNQNNKLDKTDKSEILIYDLKTMKLVARI